MCTTTMGRVVRGESSPVAAGFPGLPLLKVTEIGGATPVLRIPFSALALRLCAPLANLAVLRLKEAGLVLVSSPTAAPSTRSWMACRPESGSLAVTETVTVPVSAAPAVGAVTATTGGVVSGGAALKAAICITQPPEPSRGEVAA